MSTLDGIRSKLGPARFDALIHLLQTEYRDKSAVALMLENKFGWPHREATEMVTELVAAEAEAQAAIWRAAPWLKKNS